MIRAISPLPQPLSHWERGAGTPEFFGFLPLLPLGEGGWGGEGDFGLCQCHSFLESFYLDSASRYNLSKPH